MRCPPPTAQPLTRRVHCRPVTDDEVLVARPGEAPTVAPMDRSRIPPTDRGLLYGDGVFETVRAYDGHIFRLQDHLERLRQSAGAVALPVPWSDEDLAEALQATLSANDRSDGLARLTITRGDGWGPDVPEADPRIVVLTKAVPDRTEPLQLGFEEGLPPMSQAKTCNRLPHVTARMRARARGFDDALFVEEGDRIVEATAANVFLVEHDALATPPTPPALDGVSRRVVLRAADRMRVKVRQEPISRDRALSADDAFLTSTGLEVHPVGKIGSRAFRDRAKLTERIKRAFSGQVQEARREQGF